MEGGRYIWKGDATFGRGMLHLEGGCYIWKGDVTFGRGMLHRGCIMLHRGCIMLHRGAGWLLAGRAGHRDPATGPLEGKVCAAGCKDAGYKAAGYRIDCKMQGCNLDCRMQDANIPFTARWPR